MSMNLPQDFLTRMETLLGDEYPAFLHSYEEPRRYGLRVNTLKISVEEFVKIAPLHLTPIPWTDNGFFYEKEDAPSRHPFYYAGLYYLQEPSAMTPAQMLPVSPGERVLDLCAAPGGKATALAAKLHGKGLLVANDISASRAKALLKNLEVSGVTNSFVTCTTPAILAERFPEFFDKILVDAPCSGEGMFRKDIANANVWSLEKVKDCARTQKDIVGYAVSMLRPGGMLLYSTCTFAPEEDEQVIDYLLKTHPDMELVPVPMAEGFCKGRPELAEAFFEGRSGQAETVLESKKPFEPDKTGSEICRNERDTIPRQPEQSSPIRRQQWKNGELHGRDMKQLRTNDLSSCIRLFPHTIPGEGHFLALLRKQEQPRNDCGGRNPRALEWKNQRSLKPVQAMSSAKSLNLAEFTENLERERPEKAEKNRGKGKKPGNVKKGMDSANTELERQEFLDAFLRKIFFSDEDAAEISKHSEIHNNQVYYVPEALEPAIDSTASRGTKQKGDRFPFLRKGLYLGEIKKDRFEPSQAFAMALRSENCAAVLDFDHTDARVLRYLRGETIEVESTAQTRSISEKDTVSFCRPEQSRAHYKNSVFEKNSAVWRLVCVNGYPLGWGKLVNGTLKNKYHPGWRIRQ